MTTKLNLQLDMLDVRTLYHDPPIPIKGIDLHEQLNLFLGCVCDEWQDIDFLKSLKIEYWKIEKNFDNLIELLDEKGLNHWLDLIEANIPELELHINSNYQLTSTRIVDKDSHQTTYEYEYSNPDHKEYLDLLDHFKKLKDSLEIFLSTYNQD